MNVRTRIAPSPTGYPHIGTVYQALFNYAFAKRYNGRFVVRIEDTDRARFVEGAEDKIFSSIDWAGLSEDESPRKNGEFAPYRQSERLPIYKEYAEQLVHNGHAYYCFCTKERLDEVRKKQQEEKKPMMYDKHCRNIPADEVQQQLSTQIPHVIRMKIPEKIVIKVRDEIRGEVEFKSELIDDQVILKSDGFPTYHLAVVIDDHLMQITHIVRAEEWLPSSPKHVLLYEYFGWEMPLIYHTATLRNPDKSKLSKRHGHTNVDYYREEGFLPEAVVNFLALLGWSHPDEKEIFGLEEFISSFDLKDIKPIAPVFDNNKLLWMNGEYIRMMSDDELKSRLLQFDQSLHEIESELLNQLIPLAKTRMKTLKEFKGLIMPFIVMPDVAVSDEDKQKIQLLRQRFESLEEWTIDSIVEAIKRFNTENNVNFKYHYRVLLGVEAGLPLGDVFAILGKEKVIQLLS